MMKELTKSQQIALKVRLNDLISLTKGIATLVGRMKKDHAYINAQYLQTLNDDAGSINFIVDEIKTRCSL